HTDIDLVGKAAPPLRIACPGQVAPVRHRLSNVAWRIGGAVGYVLMRHLGIAEKLASGGYGKRAIDADGPVLRVLRRITGIKLQLRVAVQVERASREDGQQIEARLHGRNEIAGRTYVGREDVVVVGLVEFGARKPEELTH